MPIACALIPIRPPSSAIIAMRKPPWSSPRSCDSWTLQFSNVSGTVFEPRMPILSSGFPTLSPGVPPSTRKQEMPFVPGSFSRSPVRAHTTITPACAPLVIHCTAGKDRTGFACALILHTLGVADDVISEDYLLTNRFYRRDPNHSSDLPEHVKQVLGSVQPSFLGAAFEAINADYGDLETYLRDGLGLGKAERAHLEARYLT